MKASDRVPTLVSGRVIDVISVSTSRYIFVSKLNGPSSPKATREGEEERREVETRARLSGPFFFTNHQAPGREREEKSGRQENRRDVL